MFQLKENLAELDIGDRIKKVILIKEKEFKLRRNGNIIDAFLKIQDQSGEINAILWNVSRDQVAAIEKMRFSLVEGQIVKKRNLTQIQMNITSLEDAGDTIPDGLIPSTKKDIRGLMQEIDEKISSIQNVCLKGLLDLFFKDQDFRQRFMTAPAAKKLHQAYIGGLAEHTINVANLCENICQVHPEVNRDFLIGTALLHDIGKIEEYNYQGIIEYTDKGKLIGHIVLGIEMIQNKIQQMQSFPEDLAMMIKHTILSHHGKFEYGSPKLPSILPAVALYYADDTDAKINGLIGLKEENRNIEKKWSDWIWWLERSIYLDEKSILDPNFQTDTEE